MNSEKFSSAMGEIDAKYVDEAMSYRKRGRKFIPLIAACAGLLLVLPLTAFAIDTIRYNAAVDYLSSLGIPVEDLSGYSRGEIKEAARTFDAGETSRLTEELMDLLPDSGETVGASAQVTSEQIRELTPDMTREEVISFLGDTQDIGSGIYVYIYEVDGQYLLRIPFAGDDAQLGVTGEDLLKTLTSAGNETVVFDGEKFNKADLSQDTLEWLEWYNSLPMEEQLAVSAIPSELYTYGTDGTDDAER